jgi:hypothetical protein
MKRIVSRSGLAGLIVFVLAVIGFAAYRASTGMTGGMLSLGAQVIPFLLGSVAAGVTALKMLWLAD